jgi:hypothetical protein
MPTYTIWTLNRATDLIDGQEEDLISYLSRNDILSRLRRKKRMDIRFGSRNELKLNMPSVQSQSSQLMLDVDNGNIAEYFVPIPLKCIGNLYDPAKAPKTDTSLLKQIVQKYPYFPNSTNGHNKKVFTDFWQARPNGIQMFTDKTMGYYEILRLTSPNILIGYRQ